MGLRALLLPLLLSVAPLGAAAQETPPAGLLQSPILTIDVNRLLAETRFGQRMAQDLRERTEALAAENESLRLELTAEERSLTERRPGMEVDAFRAEAEAFDARVQQIRAEQDAKQQALEASVEEGRQQFLGAITPVLGRLMIESGAAVILERRDVLLSAAVVDVTEAAIEAVDSQLGEGPQDDADRQPSVPSDGSPPPDVAPPAPADGEGGPVVEPGTTPDASGGDD